MTVGTEIHPDYADEPLEVGERNLAVAARIGAAAQAFFFVAFFFAFFYLRALDTNGRWNVHHLHPSRAYGIGVLVCVLVSVAATLFAARSTRSGNASGWRVGAAVAVLAGLAAVVVQCVQYTNLGFGAGDGSFASVFVGWTILLTVNVLAVVYWLWILLAESLGRVGRTPELIRPSAEALALYWSVLGLIEVTAFVLLYVVA